MNIVIGISKNGDARRPKCLVSFTIRCQILRQFVLSAVYLYNKAVTVDVEICDIIADILLTVYSEGESF